METIFREEYLQGDQPSLQTILLTIIHIGHTSILCRFTPLHTSLCFNDFLLQDFASLLQWHCKAVAVLLQTYMQWRCNLYAVRLQHVCSGAAKRMQQECSGQAETELQAGWH